jgi:hypothetical protein
LAKGEYHFKAGNPAESFARPQRDLLTPTLTAPVVKLPLLRKEGRAIRRASSLVSD